MDPVPNDTTTGVRFGPTREARAPVPDPPLASRGHRSLITKCRAEISRPAPTHPDLPRCPLSGYPPLQEPRQCPVTLSSLQASSLHTHGLSYSAALSAKWERGLPIAPKINSECNPADSYSFCEEEPGEEALGAATVSPSCSRHREEARGGITVPVQDVAVSRHHG